jgi:tellurite resistance protein TerC
MKRFSRLWAAFKIVAAPLRKLIIALIGGTVLLIGVALIVLPGPAFIVIPIGLAILATEFAWARRAFNRARAMVARARGRQPEPSAK